MQSSLRQKFEDALLVANGASSDFDLNPDVNLDPNRSLQHAAVLIGIRERNHSIVLTKRSAKLKHHPGQIAFPGGKKDDSDQTLIDTALREAEEEIGLPRSAINVIGNLDVHETVTGFRVQPVVGLINTDFEIRPELGEVADVFDVPLDFLLDRQNYRVESRRWRGQRRYFYVVPIGPYYIWGATARMLYGLASRVEAI